MIPTQTSTGNEPDWICTICKKRGHTAQHHKDMQDVYGKIGLKTLEDIKILICGCSQCEDEAEELKSELKKAAIEWIKELYKFDTSFSYKLPNNYYFKYSEEGKNAIMNFIRAFFNIKEEDLKSAKEETENGKL